MTRTFNQLEQVNQASQWSLSLDLWVDDVSRQVLPTIKITPWETPQSSSDEGSFLKPHPGDAKQQRTT